MKLLNVDNAGCVFKRYKCEPDVCMLQVRDKKFYLDSNSLIVAEGGGDFSKVDTENFGVDWRPNYPCFQNVRPQLLILETTHNCNLACDYCFVSEFATSSLTPSLSSSSNSKRVIKD